ncbi:hypothetical protein CYMTET_36697 [Cymbomonas tetramitiformis]|uniref:Uncharacterized protein n=1 Tax=Cymbomonas tetramitiformis TaxID=36881 RepID=A0AAE0CH66_9CHLO|nr:hypothetical protein CYMTET_36697 [Cymbomonas tetramitiformis]
MWVSSPADRGFGSRVEPGRDIAARRRSSLQEAATYESLNPRNDFVAIDVTSDKQARNLSPDQRQAGATSARTATEARLSPDRDKRRRPASRRTGATSGRAASARTGDKRGDATSADS